MHRATIFFLGILLSTGLGAAPTVNVKRGPVTGIESDGLLVFKGIPYAAAPTGNLRWAPTAPVPAWEKPLVAKAFGPACPQPERPDAARDFGPQSEDCLSLNIWAPKNAKNAPVMVWIHGGAFRVGKGGTPFYDGSHFAAQGIVLVSINYRLGQLGFFAHPALTASSQDQLLGNYGIMDQLAALRWVRDNIAVFGGDPGKVTVFGESAGGSSVLSLLTIAESATLFQQAIIQSGGGTQRPRYLSKDAPAAPSLESVGLDVARQLGVDTDPDPIAAMRKLSAAKIIEGANSFDAAGIGFGPVIDGKLITQPVFLAFMSGAVPPIPIMIGSNSNEASVLAAFNTSPSALLDLLGPLKARATSVYQAESGGDTDRLAAIVFGDVSFVGPALAVARVQSKAASTFLYHLDFVREKARDTIPGANHGADVILVFNTLDAIPFSNFLFTKRDRQVAETMHGYWANFAKTGNPNGANLPNWPKYDASKDELMLIGNEKIEARGHYRSAQMDFVGEVLITNAR